MDFQHLLLDATEAVLAWDIPEAGYAVAITSLACLMAGTSPDEPCLYDPGSPA